MTFLGCKHWLWPAALALLLSACGGGAGSGGTGAMAQGYGSGTVTGFGSVIVDGERYDDSSASVEYDTEAGAPDATDRRLGRADLALGQRVEVSFETDGQARRAKLFRISPALIGPVTRLSPLQVAGQAVQVQDSPTASGPATRFGGGLTAGQQIALGDRLEVHGVLAPDGIRATRVHRLPPAHGQWLRLTGTVTGLTGNGRSFRLGALTVRLQGEGDPRMELANGQRVQVWTREPISSDTVVAEKVRVDKREFRPRQNVRFSGLVETCPDRQRSAYVCIGSTPVALTGARFDDGLDAGTLDGRYVIVRGRFDPGIDAVGEARFAPPSSP